MTDMNLLLGDVARWLTGARLVGDGAVRCARVHSDTRSLRPGDLFVALKGERFDAAAFLPEAAAPGAPSPCCATKVPPRNWRLRACRACGCPTPGRHWANWRTTGASASRDR